ncbi:MAG TPA: hypothetical protein VF736_01485 [Pyrinomonadaceae bacterium]|jgi:hypothetical protein
MSGLDDELRRALAREEPPQGFAARVLARLPDPPAHAGRPDAGHEHSQARRDRPQARGAAEGLPALVVRGARAAWHYAVEAAPAWRVSRLAGAPRVGAEPVEGRALLAEGEWLETDTHSKAKIEVGRIGFVEVEPGSRVRLVAARLRDHRLALARGALRATIYAPPRLFFVETPSATAVDLGCAYTLTVDDAGGSLLRVTHGWVALALAGRDSIVPAGAVCETRPGVGPGTPFFADASPALRAALATLDFGGEPAGVRAVALDVVLAEARARDALTLWHLLSRTGGAERGSVFARLAALAPPPPGVTREGALRLDARALKRWRRVLEAAWFEGDPAWRKAWRRLWRAVG